MRFDASVSQKAVFSLMISVAVFGIITIFAYTGLFNVIETRFYNPSTIRSLTRETERDAELIHAWLADLQGRFALSLNEPAVRRSFLPNQSAADILERSRIYGEMRVSTGGLQSVRFVDSSGRRIHFSTADSDILNQDHLSITYRDYTDDPDKLPFEAVRPGEENSTGVALDQDRIILSFPFYDSLDELQGTALFSVSVRALSERLLALGRIKPNDSLQVVSTPPGIISGGPEGPNPDLIDAVSAVWNDGLMGLTPFDSADTKASLALISAKTSQGILYGRLVNESIFIFPEPMKLLFLLSVFLTLFLALFFCLNLRQDPIGLLHNRLQELHISLIEQFYERKSELDWERWTMELEQRRKGVHAEIKRGLNISRSGLEEAEIDSLIDTSWDELLALIGSRRSGESGIDEEQLRKILSRLIRSMLTESSAAPASEKVVLPETALFEEATIPQESLVPKETLVPKEAKAPAPDYSKTDNGMTRHTLPNVGGLLAVAMKKRSLEINERPGTGTAKKEADVEEEEIEELEAIEEEEPAGKPESPEINIKALESEIEFSETISPLEDAEEINTPEIEIFSPFSSMLSPLEEEVILQEQDGIPHINSNALNPDGETEAKLDPDLKKLIGSVIKEE